LLKEKKFIKRIEKLLVVDGKEIQNTLLAAMFPRDSVFKVVAFNFLPALKAPKNRYHL